MQRSISSFCACFLLVAAIGPAAGQSHYPVPPEPQNKETVRHDSKTPQRPAVDTVQLQREAQELSELSQSILLDIQRVNQGLLPKDTIEKLKRIEKLSKHLRSGLNP
jgi:copper oxidase (laccase) domain-containing protein